MMAKKTEITWMWLSIVLGVLWILYRLFHNAGWILDDEVTHYIFSASVWENSDQIFNHWTRPGRNLVHCWVAPQGLTATRLYTLALALISVFFTYRVGSFLKVKMLWLVPMMLLFQSWFPELAYPVLTQTPFMLFWIMGVWLGLTGRWHLAGFCFGYLSLIRHEGILITALWGMWVTFGSAGFGRHVLAVLSRRTPLEGALGKLGKDALYGLSTVSAILLYNVAAYLIKGTIPFTVYFESEPTTMYGSGSLWHYLPLLLGGVGLMSMMLSVIGCFALKGRMASWSLLLLTYPMYLLLHVLIFWKGAYASGGYYHFLMPMAPLFALLAAEGVGVIAKYGGRVRVVLTFGCVALVLFQGLNMAHHQVYYQDWDAIMRGEESSEYRFFAPSLEKGELSETVVEASLWVHEQMPESQPVFAKHIAHAFTQGIRMTKQREAAECTPLYQMPVGSVYIWDCQYCEQENRIKFESFNESQDWEIVKLYPLRYVETGKTAIEDTHAVIVFQKVSDLDVKDKEYAEPGEADKYDSIYE